MFQWPCTAGLYTLRSCRRAHGLAQLAKRLHYGPSCQWGDAKLKRSHRSNSISWLFRHNPFRFQPMGSRRVSHLACSILGFTRRSLSAANHCATLASTSNARAMTTRQGAKRLGEGIQDTSMPSKARLGAHAKGLGSNRKPQAKKKYMSPRPQTSSALKILSKPPPEATSHLPTSPRRPLLLAHCW